MWSEFRNGNKTGEHRVNVYTELKRCIIGSNKRLVGFLMRR
jgi:hypothetical protein